jgi:hypothetical protein
VDLLAEIQTTCCANDAAICETFVLAFLGLVWNRKKLESAYENQAIGLIQLRLSKADYSIHDNFDRF